MRILQVYHIYPDIMGGVSKMVFNIKRELERRGRKIHVLTTDLYYSNKISTKDYSNIHRFSIILRRLSRYNLIIPEVKFFLWIKKVIKKFDCVHIHGYRNPYNILLFHYLTVNKVPYVLQAHGSLPRIGKEKVKRFYDIMFGYRLLRNALKLIAVNRNEANQYRYMGVPKEKIAIIPNGIDLSEYSDFPSKGNFKKRFNIPEEKKMILYLGRIHKIKGIDLLVKAYAHMVNKMKIRNTILVIVGPDDGYLNEVRKLSVALGVSKRVLFTGPLYGRDKLEAYVDSEFYVLPSRYETFPMAILEAYACYKPVVASKIGGLNELIVNNGTGLLFKAENHVELAEKLIYMLENPDESLKMGLNGRKLVEEKYSIEKVVDKLEDLYIQVATFR